MWQAVYGWVVPPKLFPLDITETEAEQIQAEAIEVRRDARMCDELMKSLGIPPESEGVVSTEYYDEAKRAVEEAKQVALDAASSEEERERIARVWPLQDGKPSYMADVCY